MSLTVVLVFLVASVVELYSLMWIASLISIMNTISLVMFTMLLGVIIGRGYGPEWFDKMQWSLRSGTLPADEVVNGAVMNIGARFLLTPGVVTDVLGFLITFPKTRFIAKYVALKVFKSKLSRGESWFFFKDKEP